MFGNFDSYTIKARLAPALIVLLPIGMAIGSWLPPNQELLGLLSTGTGTLALLALLSQLARRPGKALQEKLYDMWGGMPSVLMLSFRHTTLPHETLRRYHERLNLRVSGISLPLSEEDETKNYDRALKEYRAASDWLLNATRDKEEFRLVFAENVNYGYCRNLLGLKPHGLITWSIGFVACGLRACSPLIDWKLPTEWNWLAITYTLICVIMLFVWMFVVRPDWVRMVANEYTKQLIGAVDQV